MTHRWAWIVGVLLVLATSWPGTANAQYFGRNKVQYRTFDFQILKTDHFDFYYYPEEAQAAAIMGRMAERWYARLARFFGHELRGRQAVILYAASAHFRQTNAIEGLIGEGTGGVTEALKRRIVLPMSGSLADSDHVLGHELVHAFQFDLTGSDPRDGAAEAPGILDYPLWFVEGMAEYLSIGPVDAQTAMWMRDAGLREKLPRIRDLDDPKYFPYRWGHAFWSFIGAKYGDRMVASLIRSAANPRVDLIGFALQLGTDPDTLTRDWHQAIGRATQAIADEHVSLTSEARLLIGQKNGGRYNVGPRISPDGRHIAFFSERDRFSVDLFLADAETGRIDRKLLTSATDPHFDSLEFLNSAGAWSPDGRRLALTAVRDGRPVVVLIDPTNGRIRREVRLTGLDDALNPTFAPDGQALVVSGNVGGLLDLYRVRLDSGALERLTSDPFADLEPVFTPDGRSVVFASERFTTDLEALVPGPLRLAILDLETKAVRALPTFLRGKNISPQVSADGTSVTFIADPDGISNVYRMPVAGGIVERLTAVATGVAGITSVSPTLSASTNGRLAFSVFEDDGHSVYVLEPHDVVSLVPPEVGTVGALLPGRTLPGGDVYALLIDTRRGLPSLSAPTTSEQYRNRLRLDAIGQPTISAGASRFGGFMSGSASAFFSDMLGDRGLGISGSVSGTLADFGGQLVYVNRKHRWNWATAIESVPYVNGAIFRREDPDTGNVVITEVLERQPQRGPAALVSYPFNAATRFEASAAAQSVSFSQDIRTYTFDGGSRQLVDTTHEHVKVADTLYLAQTGLAIVHDTSFFGATSPIFGTRYRLELGRTSGSLQFTTGLIDFRRYFMPIRPITFSARVMHFGRYGRDSEHPQLVDLYAGYPEFVHGYGLGSFSAVECLRQAANIPCGEFDNLRGSRMAVANFEVHAPLLGLFTGRLDYGRIPIDLAAFADAGLVWSHTNGPSFAGGTHRPVRSVGGAARINVFGLLVVEISAAHPFDRADRSVQWQIGVRQGF